MQAEALRAVATVQQFPLWIAYAICWQGRVLTMHGQRQAGLEQLRQGMAAVLATGQRLSQSLCLLLLAEALGHVGQIAEGLHLLEEALAACEVSGRGDLLAEVYRL